MLEPIHSTFCRSYPHSQILIFNLKLHCHNLNLSTEKDCFRHSYHYYAPLTACVKQVLGAGTKVCCQVPGLRCPAQLGSVIVRKISRVIKLSAECLVWKSQISPILPEPDGQTRNFIVAPLYSISHCDTTIVKCRTRTRVF